MDLKEIFEENKSKQTPRVLSKGVPIEEHATKIYTRAMFEQFGEIIFQSGSYVVDEKEKGKAYLARHIRSDRWEPWSQVEFEVAIRSEDGAVVCECGLGELLGMPCCHAVNVRFSVSDRDMKLFLECDGARV
uniref:SWIM-type domain-containing protein n=1 Tax=Arundo donax TaxID=35708 RepID=A0A0A9CLL5_ARUDO